MDVKNQPQTITPAETVVTLSAQDIKVACERWIRDQTEIKGTLTSANLRFDDHECAPYARLRFVEEVKP